MGFVHCHDPFTTQRQTRPRTRPWISVDWNRESHRARRRQRSARSIFWLMFENKRITGRIDEPGAYIPHTQAHSAAPARLSAHRSRLGGSLFRPCLQPPVHQFAAHRVSQSGTQSVRLCHLYLSMGLCRQVISQSWWGPSVKRQERGGQYALVAIVGSA